MGVKGNIFGTRQGDKYLVWRGRAGCLQGTPLRRNYQRCLGKTKRGEVGGGETKEGDKGVGGKTKRRGIGGGETKRGEVGGKTKRGGVGGKTKRGEVGGKQRRGVGG